jgi:hypothetical protein
MVKALPGWRNWALVLLTASSAAVVLYAIGRLPIRRTRNT